MPEDVQNALHSLKTSRLNQSNTVSWLETENDNQRFIIKLMCFISGMLFVAGGIIGGALF